MNGPTFHLPPCPICSTPFGLDRPSWHYAAMTSAKRGHRCHVWTGCRHAAGPRGAACGVVDDPDAIAAKEEWWRGCTDVLRRWPGTGGNTMRRSR